MNRFECPASLTVLQAVDWAKRRLDSRLHPESDSRVDVEIMLGKACASSRLELYLDHARRLSLPESVRFSALVNRRIRGEPVQYVTGSAEFYGRTFAVSPAVLIPRPETERLVDHVRTFLDARKREGTGEAVATIRDRPGMNSETGCTPPVTFADIGTGTGVVAITLTLECPSAQGFATDLSEEALAIARRNAESLMRDNGRRIAFRRGSLLAALDDASTPALDLIVSNPPYVTSGEMDGLPKEIRNFEPRQALHGGEDGLACHRALIEQAPGYLRKGGMLALEIGSGQSGAAARLLANRRAYGNLKIMKDYNGLDRIISAIYVG